MSKFSKIVKIITDCQKLSQKMSTIVKVVTNCQNSPKIVKIVKNCQKNIKIVKICQNVGQAMFPHHCDQMSQR